MRRVLLTGATGVVGAEVLERLGGRGDLEVVAVSRRGSAADGIVSWHIGSESPPAALRQHFDVIVHAAAVTRWNQAPEEAWQSNVDSTASVLELVDDDTHLVHVSTAFAVSADGDTAAEDVDAYRNTYEWSKAAAERLVSSHPRTTIVRPPLIIGRRSDGHVSRFSGLYVLTRVLVAGLAPAMIGEPKSKVEIVPVDDVADALMAAVDGAPAAEPVVMGAGEDAVTTQELVDICCRALNEWRVARGHSALEVPPIVSTERWERFFFPFARDVFSDKQLRTIELLAEFIPYVSLERPPQPTLLVAPVHDAIHRAMTYWASANAGKAASEPKPWRIERDDVQDAVPQPIYA